MSMLAEPRRRQKWSTDPRGLNWSQDEDKFGQKLMEKMGWSKGKGLGANLSGDVDHVKVFAKSDNRGVGCSRSHADNWVAHQDDFNSLLASLNQDHTSGSHSDSETVKVVSLEHVSKKAKGRVHYKKFTRGKDLSNAKTQDLDCIFGRKKSKSAPCTPQSTSAVNSDEEETGDKEKPNETQAEYEGPKEDYEEQSHGVTTIVRTTSVQDYFAQKMAELKLKREAQLNNEPEQQTSESQVEQPEMANSSSNDIPSFEMNEPEEVTEVKKKKKKSKKRKREEGSNDDVVDSSPTDKEPRSKTLNQQSDETEETEETVQFEVIEKKKKKKKSKKSKVNSSSENEEESKTGLIQEEDVIPEGSENKSKKKSKKKKQKKAHDEVEDCNLEEDISPKSKKRKRDIKDRGSSSDELACEDNLKLTDEIKTSSKLTNEVNLDTVSKKNKKNKKSKVNEGEETSTKHMIISNKVDGIHPIVTPFDWNKKKQKKVKQIIQPGQQLGFPGANIDSVKGYDTS